eukprot:TRINITY_DN348_c0_g1_i1.p1 TRINITY_DN348_c0_g1~~TRINITY_DN348_c0_g1_i1.p1  ORF type:complete len:182 (-),score=32.59 TRINITY_DN348_c0_g1_i1:64-609(-)
MAGAVARRVPTWIWVWLLISFLVTLWDSFFVLLRPRSFPGNDLAWIWPPYHLYIEVDHRYKDLNDGLGYVQALLNIPEALVALYAYVKHVSGNNSSAWGYVLIVSTMTFWKTCVYMGSDAVNGFKEMAHVSTFDFYTLYFLPALPWLVLPFVILITAKNQLFSPPPHTTPTNNNNKKKKAN